MIDSILGEEWVVTQYFNLNKISKGISPKYLNFPIPSLGANTFPKITKLEDAYECNRKDVCL